MPKEPKKLAELFHDTLKDIYFAEKKILAALPKMAKAAQSRDLATVPLIKRQTISCSPGKHPVSSPTGSNWEGIHGAV